MNWRQEYEELEGRIRAFIQNAEGSFEDLALEAFAFQVRHNEPYRQFSRSLPTPSSFIEVPAVPQGAFRQFALRVFPPEAVTRVFRTSGTTGEGFGEHFFCSLALYHTAALQGWTRAKLPAPVDFALVPPVSKAPYSSLSQMADWLGAKFLFQGDSLLLDPIRCAAAEEKPITIFTTALALLRAIESGFRCDLPAGSVVVETGGYKGSGRDIPRRELYEMIADAFGSPEIANEYGMTELSSQFYARGPASPHSAPPWARAIVINPATGSEVPDGETGVLRLLDLANLGSACAIQTRDLAVRRGTDFELLGRDPAALPRGCSRSADELLAAQASSRRVSG